MIVVTGGCGFIGSRLVRGLNDAGLSEVTVVDAAAGADSQPNLGDCRYSDLIDEAEFRSALESGRMGAEVDAILHQGACTDTMETDRQYVMENNVAYPRALLEQALKRRIPFIYASSAAVYGGGDCFREEPSNEEPLNLYGESKLLFDQHVRSLLPAAASPVVGLRYFNVYGPCEAHKGRMASVVYQFYRQLRECGTIRLFEGTVGYGDGEQRRDFVYVADIVKANLHFLADSTSGIYNVGTGRSRSFNEVARTLIELNGSGSVEYVPFPDALVGRYQNHTQADLTALWEAGYRESFTPLEQGVAAYCAFLDEAAVAKRKGAA